MVFSSKNLFWAVDGGAVCRTACLKTKNAFVPQTWDKSICFCDTTQIDACASSRFAHHHARPVDNGWEPVGIYWGFPVGAALRRPFARPPQIPLPLPGTRFASAATATTLRHRFTACCDVLYAEGIDFVNPYFPQKQYPVGSFFRGPHRTSVRPLLPPPNGMGGEERKIWFPNIPLPQK